MKNAARIDRAALLRADLWRTLLFVGLILGSLVAYLKGRLTATLAVAAVGLLAVIDVVGISLRTLGHDDYKERGILKNLRQPSEPDQRILADTDPHYRVADFRYPLFSNATPSFHHANIGGYHAAKPMLFNNLTPYFSDPNGNRNVYNMYNVKYFIGPEGPQSNPSALGNAWFVDQIKVLESEDQVYRAVENLNPGETALLSSEAAEGVVETGNRITTYANIRLTQYRPDDLTYTYSADTEQFAVFSEAYYPPEKGWKTYLNGAPYDDFVKVNYGLRGLKLPAGHNNDVRMVFDPASYRVGESVAFWTSLLAILGFVGAFGLWIYRGAGLPITGLARVQKPEPVAGTKPKTVSRKSTKKTRSRR